MTFTEKLLAVQKKNNSLVCVGLDPDTAKIPHHLNGDVVLFCTAIIEATKDKVCAYKPNAAFFEALGNEGASILKQVVDAVPDDVPVIYDAKRGDIGNTASKYAKSAFDELGVDAITITPIMGKDTVEPFLEYEGKAAILWVAASNPSGGEFMNLSVDGVPLYEHVVTAAQKWGSDEQIAFVVGATKPEQLSAIRKLAPQHVFLIPGIGAQGGDVNDIKLALRKDGYGIIVNSSREIIYASDGKDFAEKAGSACEELREKLEGIKS